MNNIGIGLLVVNTVTAVLIAIIGYFIKRTIEDFGKRIDQHDAVIINLVGDVQRLVGITQFWNGHERRGNR